MLLHFQHQSSFCFSLSLFRLEMLLSGVHFPGLNPSRNNDPIMCPCCYMDRGIMRMNKSNFKIKAIYD